MGAPGASSAQGRVYIFENNWHATLVQQGHSTPNAWGHIQTLAASDAAANDKFGFAVSMSSYSSSGDPTAVLAVGAPMATGAALANAGKIYIFHRAGALLSPSAWTQAASFSVGSLGVQYATPYFTADFLYSLLPLQVPGDNWRLLWRVCCGIRVVRHRWLPSLRRH